MTLFLLSLVAIAAGQVVLNRIQTTTLGFADEVCGNLTTFVMAQFEGCAGVNFSDVPNAPCIPVGQTNCLVFGIATANTNYTSDEVELPFNWLCSDDNACGIATEDTNTSGSLGTFNGSTTFGSVNNVVGFIEGGASMTRKLRQGGALVIDKRVEYVFSFDFCFENVTTGPQTVSLRIDIANATAEIDPNFALALVTVEGDDDQSACGRLVLRIPHYNLFQHIGINGFAVTIANLNMVGGARVFIDNFLIQALPVISDDEGDTCQFPPAVVNTVEPPGTPACTRVFINEINYINVTFDGLSMDPTEAIEIAGPAGTNLTEMKIVLVNFVGSTPTALLTTIIMGDVQGDVIIPESPESPGFGFVRVAFSQGLPDALDSIGIDGIALFARETDVVPIQFICFGLNANSTTLPTVPFTCSSVVDLNNLAFNDTTDPGSVQLIGCGNCYQDFDWSFSVATTVNASGLPFQNTGQSFCRDQDADGYWESTCCGGNDCNDEVSFIFPGAAEICDGELTNCIGPAVTEEDIDDDGRLACDGDCNDNNNTIFGHAQFYVDNAIAAGALNCRAVPITGDNSHPEACDLLDNDCDGLTNEVFRTLFHFRDSDFDGFADVNADDRDIAEFPDCQVFDDNCLVTFPLGWAPNRTDCDDSDANIHPDGNSACIRNDTCESTGVQGDPPVDDNCNGRFDEADIVDLDDDGFANATASNGTAATCPRRADAFADGGDCDDSVAAINPNATEVCNAVDDNCDGLIDENLFIDLDLDGFGNATASSPTCVGVHPLNDCDDRSEIAVRLNASIGNFSRPDIAEVLCDGLDNDCNPLTPDSITESCDRIDTDCNCGLYNDPNVSFVSSCAEGDENSTQLDNGIVNDTDEDGAYAFPAAFSVQCRAVGYIFDCNDANSSFPANETCDGLDNDCDGVIDNGFFLDTDNDTFPDFEVIGCGDLYETDIDCEPNNPAVNPGVDEVGTPALACNNIDDDCNNSTGFGSNGGAGALDENSTTAILFDGDGDGFRDVTLTANICEELVLFDAFLNQPLDCDDTDPRVHPCRPDEFVCLTRIGGVKSLPCGVDEHRVCGRELVTVGGLIVSDELDNDCNDEPDDLVKFAVHLVLRGEFFDAAEATSSSSSVSSSSNDDDDDSSSSKTDQFCADIKVTLTNDSPRERDLKDIVIKGQLTLPPKGQLVEYVFGDLVNFGVKVDTRTLRVAWVQFKLAAGEQQEVVFPVCVRSRENIFGVQLSLQLQDYSLAEAIEPEPFNLQTTIADSSLTINAQ